MIRTAVLLVLLSGIEAGAQDLAAPPVFFALSVPNLEEAAQWYKDMLDLTETRLPASDVVRVALLRGNGLLVELIEHSEAFDLETRVPEGTRCTERSKLASSCSTSTRP